MRDDLEVVEHARSDTFDRVAAQDSFAMDDPPSSEEGVDPRFARAMNGVEPATELLDREILESLASDLHEDTLKSEDLAEALGPVPDNLQALQDRHSDPATERINRAALAATLLDLTVTSPVGEAGDLETSGIIDLSLPTPVRSPSSRAPVPQYPPQGASLQGPGLGTIAQSGPQTQNAPAQTPRGATPRGGVSRSEATAPSAASLELPPPEPRAPDERSDEGQLDPRIVSRMTIADEPTARPSSPASVRSSDLEPTQATQPSSFEGSVRPIDARDVALAREARALEASQVPEAMPLPLVGLVVAGSGGLVAVLGAGLLALAVTALLVWLVRGPAEVSAEPLPPIEFQQGVPPLDATPQPALPPPAPEEPAPVEDEPTEDGPTGNAPTERRPTSGRTRRPAPLPEPPPLPEPIPVVVPEEPEEIPDFEELPPRPEPEKRSLFGRKKKS